MADHLFIKSAFHQQRYMDKYLGQVVTILKIKETSILIEEDEGECPYSEGGHWRWSCRCFDHIVENEKEYSEKSSERSDFSFIFYNSPH